MYSASLLNTDDTFDVTATVNVAMTLVLLLLLFLWSMTNSIPYYSICTNTAHS